jgi:hypothetical protein
VSGDEICFEVGICRFDQYPIDANANLQQLKMSVNVYKWNYARRSEFQPQNRFRHHSLHLSVVAAKPSLTSTLCASHHPPIDANANLQQLKMSVNVYKWNYARRSGRTAVIMLSSKGHLEPVKPRRSGMQRVGQKCLVSTNPHVYLQGLNSHETCQV